MTIANILSPNIIKLNPTIKYKEWLEYLEGDNYMISDIRDKTRPLKSINRNNKELEHNTKLTYIDVRTTDYDLTLHNEYPFIGKHIVRTLSYNSLDVEFKINPLIYGDFDLDIDLNHMLKDYNSFSLLVFENTLWINDVLLEYLKRTKDVSYEMIFTVLSKIDSHKTKLLKFQYICTDKKLAIFEEETDVIKNISYEIYSNWAVLSDPWSLYYNTTLSSFFSDDKNQTALNVLTYDIAKNGLQTPLLFNSINSELKTADISRFLIAKYLKLKSIPCIFN